MTFSQGWDTGFKSVLIYIGIVFGWLIFIEDVIGNQSMSVLLMNAIAVLVAVGFFVRRRRYYFAERDQAAAEVAAILAEE